LAYLSALQTNIDERRTSLVAPRKRNKISV
jgi:integrase